MKNYLIIVYSYVARLLYLLVTAAMLFMTLLSCNTIPLHKFADNPYLPEIDYQDSSSWFTLSNMPKNLPDELKRLAKEDPVLYKALHSEGVKADVFFIHPTSFYLNNSWNQNPLNSLHISETSAIYEFLWKAFQVSAFSECCKIFAPRYRQITYGAFSDNESGLLARDLAFSDILNAFDYYIANFYEGGPIIIAGHSQGSELALRLIYERFQNSALKNKLVVAYLPGFPFGLEDLSSRMSSIPVCATRTQNSCITSWLTLSETVDLQKVQEEANTSTLNYYLGEWLPLAGKKLVCINPLSWTQEPKRIAKFNNPGSYIPIIPEFMSVPILQETTTEIIKGVASAQCQNGFLLTDAPQNQLVVSGTDYHRYDIPLFYFSIKENVQERLASYYNTKQSK